jgi:uncharacterized membrane protein YeaQ/YmgE (transglycosylase-associated protein family)
MGIVAWIVFGGLAGWFASWIMDERRGCLLNIVVGIIGALIGGLVFSRIGGSGITGFNFWSFLVAVVGSVILIFALRLFRGRDRSGRRRRR